MNDPIKPVLDDLFSQYLAVEAQKNAERLKLLELDTQGAKLQSKIVALARACDEEIAPDSRLGMFLVETAAAGITDGVRSVLKANDGWMSPSDIRTGLRRLGYDLDGYTNVLASIHTVLGRLRENKEIDRGVKKPNRSPVYRWRTLADLGPPQRKPRISLFDIVKEKKD